MVCARCPAPAGVSSCVVRKPVRPAARALEAAAQQQLGIAFGEITADAAWSLDAVYCLGNCACGPCVRIDDMVHGRVDAQRLAVLLDAAAGKPGA